MKQAGYQPPAASIGPLGRGPAAWCTQRHAGFSPRSACASTRPPRGRCCARRRRREGPRRLTAPAASSRRRSLPDALAAAPRTFAVSRPAWAARPSPAATGRRASASASRTSTTRTPAPATSARSAALTWPRLPAWATRSPQYEVVSTVGVVQDVPVEQADLVATLEMAANTSKPLVLLVSDPDQFAPCLDLLEALAPQAGRAPVRAALRQPDHAAGAQCRDYGQDDRCNRARLPRHLLELRHGRRVDADRLLCARSPCSTPSCSPAWCSARPCVRAPQSFSAACPRTSTCARWSTSTTRARCSSTWPAPR